MRYTVSTWADPHRDTCCGRYLSGRARAGTPAVSAGEVAGDLVDLVVAVVVVVVAVVAVGFINNCAALVVVVVVVMVVVGVVLFPGRRVMMTSLTLFPSDDVMR